MADSSSPATWAAVLGLLAASSSCTTFTTAGACETDKLPDGDPCKDKPCCAEVYVDADGGVTSADAGGTYRLCGACNG